MICDTCLLYMSLLLHLPSKKKIGKNEFSCLDLDKGRKRQYLIVLLISYGKIATLDIQIKC